LTTKRSLQRNRSWETAIERSTETGRQRQLRARPGFVAQTDFEEDAIEARFFAKMKDENVIAKPEAEFLVDFEKGSPMPR